MAAQQIGAVKINPTRHAINPTIERTTQRIINPNKEGHCFITTFRLSSMASQKPIFLSITSGKVKTQIRDNTTNANRLEAIPIANGRLNKVEGSKSLGFCMAPKI